MNQNDSKLKLIMMGVIMIFVSLIVIQLLFIGIVIFQKEDIKQDLKAELVEQYPVETIPETKESLISKETQVSQTVVPETKKETVKVETVPQTEAMKAEDVHITVSVTDELKERLGTEGMTNLNVSISRHIAQNNFRDVTRADYIEDTFGISETNVAFELLLDNGRKIYVSYTLEDGSFYIENR